jgi:hypothetical protein
VSNPDAQGVFLATLQDTVSAFRADHPPVKHPNQAWRAFGNIIVGSGLGSFGVQIQALSDLVRNSQHDCVQLSCLIPEPGFPVLSKLLELNRAISILPGTKDPDLLETYRITVVVQLPASVDQAALADQMSALAQDVLADATERLETAGYGDQLSRGIKPVKN